MCLRLQGFTALALLVSALGASGCGASEPDAKAIAAPKPAPAPPEPQARASPPSASDLDANQIADLEAMCAAVDHDYNDGTLSDYFKGLACQTAWGEELRERADESTTPGRVLLQAAKQAGLSNTDTRTPACARIFDYIDDVE
jgi:hypothetical protein